MIDNYVMHTNTDNMTTEEKILKAAEREFIDKGYAGARTTSIAAAAGVTHAMLHYYFRTKEKLFQHILEDKLIFIRGMMLTHLIDTDRQILENVKIAIETHLDFLSANPDLPRFMLTVLNGYPEFTRYIKERVNDGNQDIVRILQEEIDRSAGLGLCRQTDAGMLLLDIISINVFSFVAAPLINSIMGELTLDENFIEQRKRNNVELIMKKLRP